jgi:hypothetical protein
MNSQQKYAEDKMKNSKLKNEHIIHSENKW